jgi:dTMP kinase
MPDKNNGPRGAAREVLHGFFVLEGIDGAGTTTQLKRLESRARAEGFALRADCEPTPHPVGVLIRSILRYQVDAHPAVLAPLFAADRRQHLDGHGGVRQTVAAGTRVVSDRYFFSSLAYQSLDRPWDEVWALNAPFPLPEALFWFEVPVSEAQARIDRRGQAREKFEDAPTQERIRLAYHRAVAEAEAEGLEVIRLDASASIEALTDSIWSRICR